MYIRCGGVSNYSKKVYICIKFCDVFTVLESIILITCSQLRNSRKEPVLNKRTNLPKLLFPIQVTKKYKQIDIFYCSYIVTLYKYSVFMKIIIKPFFYSSFSSGLYKKL